MIIQPKGRGFICTTAHPTGCFETVKRQIDYVKSQGPLKGPKNVLVIGGSTGYGMASRIVSTFAAGAKTIGVAFERPASDKRTASPGWYNTAAFETYAHAAGYYATSIMGDAFSTEIKEQTAQRIKDDLGQIDCLIYSLAAPARLHPVTGEKFNSVLKPIGKPYSNKTVEPLTGEVKMVTIEPATEADIANTVAVMGGEDWAMWIDFLNSRQLLAPQFETVAYNYIGPELTYPVYKNGTIGRAKEDLLKTAHELNRKLADKGGRAYLSVNKALVTQASAAIPVVPLYISILYKLMKAKGTHEGCIEQIYRLFKHAIHSPTLKTDQEGNFRLDDLEMAADIQEKVVELWKTVNTENLAELTDIAGYRDDFYRLFGFNYENIDTLAEVDPEVAIPSLVEQAV